ncbi:inositol monophosphatase family protein [Candidatus Palauibacter sp.]|uniref:inositol monophosphatase family protein n=1 Tax=Candidatus Palauibacter sp. TaxID=3101350 RepID=UPI003B51FDEA
MTPEDDALIETSLLAAREAAALQREMQGAIDPAEAVDKGWRDFVTVVDRESARLIVDRVRARFPRHAVLAEDDPREMSDAGGSDERMLWVIDPLDGTTNWLHGYPSWGVSIATVDARGLRTAVVVNGANGEEFTARRGGGARRDGEPIRVSAVSDPGLALLGTGFPFKRREMIPRYLAVLGRMLEASSGVRRAGAAALDLCDVACGRLDGFWEHWLMPWDVAAGALIVQEAGGNFSALPSAEDAVGNPLGDPPLDEAIRGGDRIIRAFAGETELDREIGLDRKTGGGFLAGNGRLEPWLREVWSEAARS